jgi:uncharacterized protein YaaQ
MDPRPKTRSLLLMVIMQDQDVDQVQRGLQKINLTSSILSSTGGFLGQKNTTLLIGCTEIQFREVESVLQENCRQRVGYMPVGMSTNPENMLMAASLPILIGGATVFSFEVESQEGSK